ncbi:MAG: DUF4038 domain-containing protein [Lachnospiraceae bacterium]|nr:DUF4038 domain-containing protein [Lachnospiraceae bacterium]
MRQYETFEISIKSEEPRENSAQVDACAEFFVGEKTYNIKGFYAGDGIYKFRFLPEETGEVRWKITGVVCGEGSEICEPAENGAKGIVRALKTHLKYENGDFFFSFGTTIYALAHQDEKLTEETFESLKKAPFNKVRMCLFPKHYDYNVDDPKLFPFELKEGAVYTYERGDTFNSYAFNSKKAKYWNVKKPNFKFWDEFEDKIKRLDKLGIQVDLILFHPYDRWGFSALSNEENLIYLDYLMRRFAAFPNIWWSMSNEYDLCEAKTIEDWHCIEEFIAKNDPYHHLLSNHNCWPMYDFSRENITHCSIQKRTMTLTAGLAKKYNKPVLYDECAYEGNLKQTWGSISAAEMTNRFWKVTVNGGYCTHGEVYLDDDIKDIDKAVLWWAKGGKLKGSSPARIAYLRDIIEEIGEPLDFYASGFSAMLERARENETFRRSIPSNLGNFALNQKNMDPVEFALQDSSEAVFAGHTKDDSHILFYYGTECSSRVDIELPKDKKYKVDVIDVWNMTRKTFSEGASGTFEVRLPGHEYMAVLCEKA